MRAICFHSSHCKKHDVHQRVCVVVFSFSQDGLPLAFRVHLRFRRSPRAFYSPEHRHDENGQHRFVFRKPKSGVGIVNALHVYVKFIRDPVISDDQIVVLSRV